MHRIRELDSIRAISIVLVMLSHTVFPDPAVNQAFRIGFAGVDIFFILSGYLITGIILKNLDKPRGEFLKSFYMRRFLRIFPIYYLMVLATYALARAGLAQPMTGGALARYLTYTQCYPFSDPRFQHESFLNATWSLAVEEQFYLVWPALLLALGGRRGGMIALTAGLVVASVATRGLGFSPWQIMGRSEGLALGSLIAIGMQGRDWAATGPPRMLVAALVAVAAAGAGSMLATRLLIRLARSRGLAVGLTAQFEVDIFSISVLGTGLIWLVVLYSGHRRLAWLRFRPVAFIGVISYGIYLYHQMAFYYADRWLADARGATPASILAGYGGTLALAVASWYLIERPILGLKGRFSYGGKGRPAAPGAPKVQVAAEDAMAAPSA